MNPPNQSDSTPQNEGANRLKRGRVRMPEVPKWRIRLAAPFFKIGIWILGGRDITLEEAPPTSPTHPIHRPNPKGNKP